ncbi:hypothetical protein ACWEKR_33665 [Nocardia sp. NPDC004573]
MLDYAIERKLSTHNVSRAIRPKAGKKRKPLTYTPEERSKLPAGLEADRDGHLWSAVPSRHPDASVGDARHTCGTTTHLRKVPLAIIAAWLATPTPASPRGSTPILPRKR